ncbi:MAG: prepilin peptidase [Butyrivibrio sp.]
MQAEILLYIMMYVLIFIFGTVVGSFVNVLIYRLPKKENIVVVNSHCMSCGHRLKWYDLVPLFSWMFLRGRCRYCGSKVSVQYPLVEAINGFGYVLIFLICGMNLSSILYVLCFSMLVAISVIDWRTYEIPFGLNVTIFVLGIIQCAVDYRNWPLYLIGMVGVSGFLLLLFIITGGRGIGGGDIKLMFAAGLLIGWKKSILALILGCIIGSVIHLILMKVSKKGRMLAFGPYLSAGILLAILFGDQLINRYMELFYFI